MATQASIDQVQKIYIAYYGRPADPAGLEAWANALDDAGGDLSAIIDAFGTSPEAEARFGGLSSEETIITLYNQLFDRDPESQEIIDAWVDQLENNPAVTAQSIALDLLNGAQNEDAAVIANKCEVAARFTEALDTDAEVAAYAGQDAVDAGVELLAPVGSSTNAATFDVHSTINGLVSPEGVFTLTENTVTTVTPAVDGEVLTKMVTYWGFNPHSNDETDVDNLDGNDPSGNDNNLTNEGVSDGGVPVSELLSYLTGLAASGGFVDSLNDLFDVVGIDPSDVTIDQDTFDFSSVQTLGVTTGDGDGDNGMTLTLGFENDAGEFATAEVALGEQVSSLFSDMIFDEEGNSRLFEVEVPQTVYVAAIDGLPFTTIGSGSDAVDVLIGTDGEPIEVEYVHGAEDASSETSAHIPAILTTTANNGGTEEDGFTSPADNTIVAARLDLLHGAYIDAGQGDNTLEIHAKGYYAQPKQLLNIQTISVQNLPNVYTDGSGDSQYPDLQSSGSGYEDSIIDISTASDLEELLVSVSDFDALGSGSGAETSAGDLTIAGIRNGATVTLDGHFGDDNVTLNFRETADEGVNLVLRNVNMDEATLDLAHNAPTLNIESTGGSNVIEDSNLGNTNANLTNLNITGDASLYIGRRDDDAGDIADAFAEEADVTIDASANTAGVSLNFGHAETFTGSLTFLGTDANDYLYASADRAVTVTAGEGDDQYDIDSNSDIVITAGDGNNSIEASSSDDGELENEATVTVTVGDGQNDITVSSSDAFTITAGDGDNRIEASGDTSTGVTDGDVNTIVVGDGQNEIDASGQQVAITTGNGVNEIDVSAEVATITTGAGDDVIAATGSSDSTDSVTIDAGEGNNTVTVVDYETVVVTTGAGDDSLTIVGGDVDFNSADGSSGGAVSGGSEDGQETLITVDLGAGTNTLTVGTDGSSDSQAITAIDGSTINGENITLVVQSEADLSRADINGVTAVQLGNNDSLQLTVSQFVAMGGSTAFSVIGESFGAHSTLVLVVDESTSLDALDIESLPRSIDLEFEIKDGVQLEMTARQLHERVAEEGVRHFDDNNTDFAQGTVLITDAGDDFDAYSAGQGGGSLDSDFDADSARVSRDGELYDRPSEQPEGSRRLIDTDEHSGTHDMISSADDFLWIIGDADLTFVPVVGGVDEWGNVSSSQSAIELTGGEDYMVSFANATGNIEGMVLGNFEDASGVYGNGTSSNPVRIDVHINEAESGDLDPGVGEVGSEEQGLVSSGVQTFVVTDIEENSSGDGDIDFYTCETTQHLETLGMQGLYTYEVNFLNTERGVEFLMEVDYAKADGYVVGSLHGEFARSGADAVVNVVGLQALPAGETQMVEGIELTNADTATINIEGGNTEIVSFTGNDVSELTLTADANVEFPDIRADDIAAFDASGVVGELEITVDGSGGDDGMTFVGAAGGTDLTLLDVGVDGIDSISGTGAIALTIDGTVDLTEATLTNIASVTLLDGATLSLTMEQADAIGAANFVLAEGDAATLNLVGLSDQEFALANYDVEGTLTVTLTLANDPVVTLHPNTDLTGIAGLVIPEGTVLELTMEQFQQLDDEGTLTGDGSVVITDVTQASVGEEGADLDLDDVDLTGTVTLTLAESVDLSEADLQDSGASVDTFNIGDDMTLTVGDFDDLDGVALSGGTNSVTVIEDSTLPDGASGGSGGGIDASGFDITEIHFLNVVAGGVNVDEDLFVSLPGSVQKVIYNGEGTATPIAQTVTIEEQTSIDGSWTGFNYSGEDFEPHEVVEITDFTLNLEGGVFIAGDVELSTDEKINPDNDAYLLTTGLELVTINSTGTEANLLNDETANVIDGKLTPMDGGNIDGAENNTLLDVVINATQELQINGGIEFNSWGDDGGDLDDDWTINDNTEASATVTVNGTADVALGNLDTSDDDVDALTVNNAGTGTVTATVGSAVDAADVLSFTGSNIELTVDATLDLSDDTITGVSSIEIDGASTLTLSFTQFTTLGIANVTDADDDSGATALAINAYDGSAFDFTTIDEDIETVTLVLDGTDVTLDAGVNLTGVSSIDANGGSLTLTAAQFQQLEGNGTITGAVNVTITGLTQADIDAGSFDLSDISASGDVTVELAENVNLSDDDDIENATNVSIGSLHLGLATHEQADDLVVTGDAASIVTFLFDIDYATNGEIEAAGYNVGTLRAIAETVAGLDVDVVLDNLPNSVTKSLYETAEEVGYVSSIHQVVIIEDGVAVPGDLIFNAQDDTREMRTLSITFEGDANDGRTELEDQDGNLEGSVITGDLILHRTSEDSELTALLFQTLTLNSEGTGNSNAITGDIIAAGTTSDIEQVLDETVAAGQTVSIEVNGTVYSALFITDAATTMAALAAAIEAGETDLQVTVVDDGLNINGAAGFTIDTDLAKDAGVTTSTTTVTTGLENNLLDIVINADSDFEVGGDIIFSSVDADATAQLTVNGAADTTIQSLDVTDSDIIALAVANNGTGTLTVTGASPSVEADTGALETITLTGTGAMYFGTDEGDAEDQADGIDGGSTLSTVDASGLSGALTIEALEDLDEANFAFTAGTGVTIVTLTDADLDATDAGEAGWSFDMTNAAAGSELHLDAALTGAVAASTLTISATSNTTIYVDQTMDLSDLNLTLPTGVNIVVADGATLTLTAAQANGLTIIGENGVDSTGVVDIVALDDSPVDLSGISADIAGHAYLTTTAVAADVTLDVATDLGSFAVALFELSDATDSLLGQTIRFETEAQAERTIDIISLGDAYGDFATGDNTTGSSNVAWLFDSITASIDTSGYDGELGRLWLNSTLIDAEGGDVEQLFTTLPDTILRVDFGDITELDILLSSTAIDRVMEVTSFNNLSDLTFSDTGLDPVEHLNSLTLLLGGEVTIGNIVLDDVVGTPGYDPDTVDFTTLTIESYRHLTTGDLLASEGYVNNNDGTADAGEYAQPDNINTVGDISVGTDNGIDLLDVVLDVGSVTVVGDSSSGEGADLVVGDIEFETDEAGSTAELELIGANDITIASIDTSDADITAFDLDISFFTGVLDPVMNMDNTETWTITDGEDAADIADLSFEEVEGNELSVVDFSDSNDNITVTFSEVDSNDDDTDDAFTYTASTGVNTVTVMAVGGNVPTLEAGSTWHFDMDGAGAGSSVTIGAGTVLEPGSTLDVDLADGVTLEIDDSVDLTDVTLDVTGGDLVVTEGSTLTLTVAQVTALEAAGIFVFGPGTVEVVNGAGDATDAEDSDPIFSVLRTATVDLSALTITDADDSDGDLDITLNEFGAINALDSATLTFTADDVDDDDETVTISYIATAENGSTSATGSTQVIDLSGIDVTDADAIAAEVAAQLAGDFTDAGEITVDGNVVTINAKLWGEDIEAAVDAVGGTTGGLAGTSSDAAEEDASGITVIGSDEDDVITDTNLDDTFTMGLGDDAIDLASGGSDTVNVDAGTDTVVDLAADGAAESGDDDVLVVSAGATADAATDGDFVATSDTSNAGTANITAAKAGMGAVEVDMTEASGPNGYNITGMAADGTANTLIGSAFDDTINGGDAAQDAAIDVDTLTGNAGADIFEFDITISDPADLTDAIDTPAEDIETLTFTADGADNDDEIFNINYSLNNTLNSIVVDASGIDVTDADAVAALVQAELDAITGITATVISNVVSIEGDEVDGTGNAFEVTSVTENAGTFTAGDIDDGSFVAIGEGTDVAQSNTLTVDLGGGTATLGETYNVTITLKDGTAIVADEYEALGTENAATLAAALKTEIDNASGGALTVTDNADGTLTIVAADDDEGGFLITTLTASGAYDGSGASGNLNDPAEDEVTFVDVITDFVSGEDQIDIADLAAGDNSNYLEAADVAFDTDVQTTFETALTNANAAMDGTVQYYLTAGGDDAATTGDDESMGYLFFDANLDGTADGVIALTGITQANFDETDIIA